MSDSDRSAGISVRTMVMGVMLLVAYICWAIAASAYLDPLIEVDGPGAGSFRSSRSAAFRALITSAISFVGNSLQVHKAPAIAANTFRNERWILGLFVVLEVVAACFGAWVKMLDAKLNPPKRKLKRPSTGPRLEKPKRRPREGM